MVNRFILNEVSYFGPGARKQIPEVVARLGFKKALVVTDKGLMKFGVAKMVLDVLDDAKIPYQIEVESSGGSDGNDIQKSPFPIDWCFIGAPEDLVHTPDEKVHKSDIDSMLKAYRILMDAL